MEKVGWEIGPKGKYMHNTCYASLSSKCCLSQAQARKRKFQEHLERETSSDEEDTSPEASCSPEKHRSSVGILHEKNFCVWCTSTYQEQ